MNQKVGSQSEATCIGSAYYLDGGRVVEVEPEVVVDALDGLGAVGVRHEHSFVGRVGAPALLLTGGWVSVGLGVGVGVGAGCESGYSCERGCGCGCARARVGALARKRACVLCVCESLNSPLLMFLPRRPGCATRCGS